LDYPGLIKLPKMGCFRVDRGHHLNHRGRSGQSGVLVPPTVGPVLKPPVQDDQINLMDGKDVTRGFFNTNRWNRIRYTLWAPVYNFPLLIFTARRRRAIELASIRAGERVLIVGAGTGLDLDHLPRQASITAIDITPAMITRLQKRARRLGVSVEAKVMDGQALEFPEATFNVVLLHFIMAVIPDPVRCLQEVTRVLRPGGRAVILDKFVPDGAKPAVILRLLQPLMSFLASELTRKLDPLVATTGLRRVHHEPAGYNGLFQIAVFEKPESTSQPEP
jgi:phosphatidylethanolamine/phosphatidyl-N-methylethanolamine N-methyltransferase